MTEITEDQLSDIKECFSIFDQRGDNTIDEFQIMQVLQSLKLNPLTKDINKLIKDSKLANQKVSFEAFLAIYQQCLQTSGSIKFDEIMEGFRTLDHENSGMATVAEIRHLLGNFGDKMTDDEIETILSYQEDKDGSINYELLIRTIMAG